MREFAITRIIARTSTSRTCTSPGMFVHINGLLDLTYISATYVACEVSLQRQCTEELLAPATNSTTNVCRALEGAMRHHGKAPGI